MGLRWGTGPVGAPMRDGGLEGGVGAVSALDELPEAKAINRSHSSGHLQPDLLIVFVLDRPSRGRYIPHPALEAAIGAPTGPVGGPRTTSTTSRTSETTIFDWVDEISTSLVL